MLVLATLAPAQRNVPDRPIGMSARGTRGAVAAGSNGAAMAGMQIFEKGGNAVDAGVATTYAAAVVEYSHFGWGGEAPILIRTREGKVVAISGVGTMPKLATAEMFRRRPLQAGEVLATEPNGLKGMVPVAGLMPALVPGMVDATLVALKEFGTLRFEQVVAPAIFLADSAPVDEMRATSLARSRPFFELWPSSKAVFAPNGRTPRAGQLLHQRDLARTLRSMVEVEKKAREAGASREAAIDAVRDYFYRGDIARRISAFVEQNGGLLRYDDFAAFHAEVEEPVSTVFQGYRVYKPGFWSQGPAMIEALNILKGYNFAAMGYNSAEYIHILVEALKLAYADRDTYYGDPRFTKLPLHDLLSQQYADERRKLITDKASMEFRPGVLDGKRGTHPSESTIVRFPIDAALMARDTTCVDAIDKDGVMFSETPSGAWMPAVIAGDTGIALTQRAQSFLLIPGHPNELAGGKRPRVTLSPTLVTRDGQPAMVLSTPGGDNQDQALIQVFLNMIDFGMPAQSAVEAGRFETRHLVSSFDNHAMSPGDLDVDERTAPAVMVDLRNRGHKLSTHPPWASGAAPVAIRVLPDGVIEAGADLYYRRVAIAW